ncbi:MAG: hypothetical protein RR718_15930 [Comamonas sp.]
MQDKLWRLAGSAMVVLSLAGCSTMTDKVSQTVSSTWNKTLSSLSWQSQPKTQAASEAASPSKPAAQAAAASRLQPSKASGRWQGLYQLQGDKGSFQECASGQTIAVLVEGDNVLLEQAYLNPRSSATASMLAEVTGQVVELPAADPVLAQQGQKRLALRVERLVSLSSKNFCPQSAGWR